MQNRSCECDSKMTVLEHLGQEMKRFQFS